MEADISGNAISNDSSIAWIEVRSSSTSVTCHFLEFDAMLCELEGTALTQSISSFLLPEIETSGITNINVANSSTSPATMRVVKPGQ